MPVISSQARVLTPVVMFIVQEIKKKIALVTSNGDIINTLGINPLTERLRTTTHIHDHNAH